MSYTIEIHWKKGGHVRAENPDPAFVKILAEQMLEDAGFTWEWHAYMVPVAPMCEQAAQPATAATSAAASAPEPDSSEPVA